MTIIGIDMSKNSPGVCVREDDKLTFISFIRGAETKRNTGHFSTLRERGVQIVMNPRGTKEKDYSELEIWKIEDASLLAKTIVSQLPEEADMVGIEGFSYGSKGNSGLDIAGYAYCLRQAIYEKYGKKMCIFAPSNVKKTAGKGNAGKPEIKKFFLESDDQTLKLNMFWKGLYENEIVDEKPVDDLIDAYYVQECTRQYYQSKLMVTI
jgi:hypothetical protein